MDIQNIAEVAIGTAVGAFCGCLFGVGTYGFGKRKAACGLKKAILAELGKIHSTIQHNVDSNKPLIYQTDAWDIAKSSDVFVKIVSDVNYYLKISKIYNYVSKLSEEEHELSKTNSDFYAVKENREELMELICSAFR